MILVSSFQMAIRPSSPTHKREDGPAAKAYRTIFCRTSPFRRPWPGRTPAVPSRRSQWRVRTVSRPPRPAGLRRMPGHDCLARHSHRQAAAVTQRNVLLSPVLHPVPCLWEPVTARFVMLVRHRRIIATGPAGEATILLQRATSPARQRFVHQRRLKTFDDGHTASRSESSAILPRLPLAQNRQSAALVSDRLFVYYFSLVRGLWVRSVCRSMGSEDHVHQCGGVWRQEQPLVCAREVRVHKFSPGNSKHVFQALGAARLCPVQIFANPNL